LSYFKFYYNHLSKNLKKRNNSSLRAFVLIGQKRLTQRAPDAGDSAQISGSFQRLVIFLAGRLRRPRPSAGNANRWVLSRNKKREDKKS